MNDWCLYLNAYTTRNERDWPHRLFVDKWRLCPFCPIAIGQLICGHLGKLRAATTGPFEWLRGHRLALCPPSISSTANSRPELRRMPPTPLKSFQLYNPNCSLPLHSASITVPVSFVYHIHVIFCSNAYKFDVSWKQKCVDMTVLYTVNGKRVIYMCYPQSWNCLGGVDWNPDLDSYFNPLNSTLSKS